MIQSLFTPPLSLKGSIRNLLKERVKLSPNSIGFVSKGESNELFQWTWREIYQLVLETTKKLNKLGINHDSKVGLLIQSNASWEIVHWSLLWIGAECIGLETNYKDDKIKFIIENSQLSHFIHHQQFKQAIPLTQKITFIPLESEIGDLELLNKLVIQYRNSLKITTESIINDPTNHFKEIDENLLPLQTATQIYTSGTTGKPKKFSYTHGQLIETISVLDSHYLEMKVSQNIASWLPLANLFQRITNLLAVKKGLTIYFVNNPAEIMSELLWIQPHYIIGVPRLFEKIYLSINSNIKISNFILFYSDTYNSLKSHHSPYSYFLYPLFKLFDLMLFSRIRKIFGNNIHFIISGSAPIRSEILYFFRTCGVPILEAYGMSENILPVCLSTLKSYKIGSVGKPSIPKSVNIDNQERVNVLNFGLHKDAPLIDGWFQTTDLGAIDEEGFLSLHGRDSDYIKTSTGRRISVLPMEFMIKELHIIEHAIVVGDNLKFLVAIIDLNRENIKHLNSETLEEKIKSHLKSINKNLEFPIIGVIISHSSFSVKTGELTENLKLKRRVIIENYRQWIFEIENKIDESSKKNKNEQSFTPNQNIELTFALSESTDLILPESRKRSDVKLNNITQALKAHVFFRFISILFIFLKAFPYYFLLKLQKADTNLKNRISLNIVKIIRDGLIPMRGPLLKVGQIVNNSGFSHPILKELITPLLSKSHPLPFSLIKDIIEKELKQNIESLFSEISESPIAVASISQVHFGVLKSGEKVVIKVKFPHIDEIMKSDLKLLRILFFIAKFMSPIKNLNQVRIKLSEILSYEIDFLNEAKSMIEFKEYFKNNPDIYVPKVYQNLSTSSLLICEFLNGSSLSSYFNIGTNLGKKHLARTIWNYTAESINVFKRFNADPDPENFIILNPLSDKPILGLIDFGFFIHWSESFIRSWQLQTYSAMNNDLEQFQEACYQLGIFKLKNDPRTFEFMQILKEKVYPSWMYDHVFKFDESFLKQELNAIYHFFLKGPEIQIPPDFIGVFRLFWGIHIIMVRLGAEGNWHKESIHLIFSTLDNQKISS